MERLETPLLLLRPIQPEDAELVFTLTALPEVGGNLRYGAHTCLSQTAEMIGQYCAPGNHGFMVFEKTTGEFVGVCALKRDNKKETDFGLTTFTSPTHWNRGYNTQLVECLDRYAYEKLHGETVTAYVMEQNIGSKRILEKNGYRCIHTFEDDDSERCVHIYQKNLCTQ